MQDPREIAWQSRCDDHSHNNAIRVAFATIYARAIPNARFKQYYKSKHRSVQQWVTAKQGLENALIIAEDVEQAGGGQDQVMPGADTAMNGAMVLGSGVREGEGRFILGKQKTLPAKVTREGKAVGGTKAMVGMKAKKKRSELELLLGALRQGMGNSGITTVPENNNEITGGASGDIITEDNPLIPAPISPAEQTSTELQQAMKRPRMKLTPSIKPVPNTKTKRTPKPRTTTSSPLAPKHQRTTPKPSTKKLTDEVNKKKAEQTEPNTTQKPPKTTSNYTNPELPSQSLINYNIPPCVPGIIEVIYDHYPILRAQTKKRTNEAARARLDTGRLVLMCMKAAGQKNTVKVGVDNSVVGRMGELVFLRRNVVRVKRGMEVGR